jgi:excisionase family DNA binding protein
MLTVKQAAALLNTSVRTIYRCLDKGLPFYELPGGIKIAPADLEAFKEGHKQCLSGKIGTDVTTLPSNEKESEFIESAQRRRRGGTRKGRKPTSSSVSTFPSPVRS